MSKTCHYCGYENRFPHSENPRRCPICGNPYGHKPKRKLTGRYTKGFFFFMVLVGLLVVPCSGLSLTFQDYSYFNQYVRCSDTTANCFWNQNVTGGNSDMDTYTYRQIVTTIPQTFTYAAVTSVNSGFLAITLFDSSGTVIYNGHGFGVNTYSRVEIKVIGGVAYVYVDGVERDRSGILSVNPSYFGIGNPWYPSSAQTDDMIVGDTENRYIFGSPAQGFFVKKDLFNPAAYGVCYPNGTIASSYNLTTTYGFGDSNASQTIRLQNYGSGVVVGTYTTPTGKMAGVIEWPIQDMMINNPDAKYGFYVTTVDGSGEYSNPILYTSGGATVNWEDTTYVTGDTATVNYVVSEAPIDYWDTTTYKYYVEILDVYATRKQNTQIFTPTGSVSYTFTTDDSDGIYYAQLYAVPIAGGDDIPMGYDTTSLSGSMKLTGDVRCAINGTIISGANVSITQTTGAGSTAYNHITGSSGNYTTNTTLYIDSPIYINVTAANHRQYTFQFTPVAAKTIGLNISMIPLVVNTSGYGIGGVIRDTTYGRPISNASVSVINSTYGQAWYVTTNPYGWYLLQDGGSGGIVTPRLSWGRCYNVQASKTGYLTSTNYTKCINGGV